MYSKLNVTLLLVFTCILAINAKSSSLDVNTNISLLRLMARSSDLMQRNPSRSTECFNYYIPLIDEIAKSYQQNHVSCLQASRDGRAEAEAATLEKRNALAASASSSCDSLSQCSDISSAESVFECFVKGGAENVKTMYAINVNAAEHLSDLQEQFRLVENREYKCTNETKRQYERDSSKAYEDFNKCILGIIDIPATTEPPVEPETTEKPEAPESTANPEESTQAPVEPETTEAPESTTDPDKTTQEPNEPESTEYAEASDESDELNPESKLPEEDLSNFIYSKL